MPDAESIIKAIDEFLDSKHQETTTPVEINPHLEKKGLLKDSKSRPGKPIRKMIQNGQIPHAYKKGANWKIPHSKKASSNLKLVNQTIFNKEIPSQVSTNKCKKLAPIGDLIVKIMEEKYNIKPSCTYEYKPDWLLSYPSKKLIEKRPEIIEVYRELTEDQFSLSIKIQEIPFKKLKQKQSYDIWIGKPFYFAVEFDEKQHFNQFRKITLDFYDKIDIKFPLQYYKELNDEVEIRPGKSGFTKLKSNDPLFPEILEGEKQDNRTRQRAYRDFLKDLLPIEAGYNPTLRIPYHITSKKIKDFSFADLRKVENYISKYGLI